MYLKVIFVKILSNAFCVREFNNLMSVYLLRKVGIRPVFLSGKIVLTRNEHLRDLFISDSNYVVSKVAKIDEKFISFCLYR